MKRAEILPNCALFEFRSIEDQRGGLIALEGGCQVPFEIARVYYLFDTPHGAERGFHAHRELNQMAVCVAGACTIAVDDGVARREVRLDSPDKGLHIGTMVWREMRDFSPGAVLMVLASAPYDEADYIRSYEDFSAAVRGEEG